LSLKLSTIDNVCIWQHDQIFGCKQSKILSCIIFKYTMPKWSYVYLTTLLTKWLFNHCNDFMLNQNCGVHAQGPQVFLYALFLILKSLIKYSTCTLWFFYCCHNCVSRSSILFNKVLSPWPDIHVSSSIKCNNSSLNMGGFDVLVFCAPSYSS